MVQDNFVIWIRTPAKRVGVHSSKPLETEGWVVWTGPQKERLRLTTELILSVNTGGGGYTQ